MELCEFHFYRWRHRFNDIPENIFHRPSAGGFIGAGSTLNPGS